MTTETYYNSFSVKKPLIATFGILMLTGILSFSALIFTDRPERAWQAYLVNFMLWSAIAQGGLLFSIVMHLVKATWSRQLSRLSHSFVMFFPVSLVFYIFLFLGKEFVFPWLHQDLHGKEIWLNLPFLFTRDMVGLALLYGSGFAFVFYAEKSKFRNEIYPLQKNISGRIRTKLIKKWKLSEMDEQQCKRRMSFFGVLYAVLFGVVHSLLAHDLILSAEPHFVSTLFGAYSFVKAFYVGIGVLIIFASVLHLSPACEFKLSSGQFHDLGKLLLGFCLVWADFFYCQLVVIWYGNISEEAHYLITRTMLSPWKELAWFVFIIAFIIPFVILINKAVKTKPKLMTLLSIVIIMGIWLEHLLLLGPALNPDAVAIPLGLSDGLIFMGFLGLMAVCVTSYLNIFPEILHKDIHGNNHRENRETTTKDITGTEAEAT